MRTKSDPAVGVFSALIVIFLFGFFVGLPVILWVLLAAAFVGVLVATRDRRARERDAEKVPAGVPDRPWDKGE